MTAKRKTKKATPTRRSKDESDLRGAFAALRDDIRRTHGTRPGKTARQSAVRDAWDAIVKPRRANMKRRLDDIVKSKRWLLTDDGRGTALIAPHWDRVIRSDAAPLFSELAGILFQYCRVRIVWREKARFGFVRGRNAPVADIDAIAKQVERAHKEFEKRVTKERQTYRKTMEAILKAWGERREATAEQMRALQSTLAAAMAVEEQRLTSTLDSLGEELKAKDRERVRAQLAEMETRRLDAEAFRTDAGQRSSLYGSMLRKWNGARRKASRVLA